MPLASLFILSFLNIHNEQHLALKVRPAYEPTHHTHHQYLLTELDDALTMKRTSICHGKLGRAAHGSSAR